VRAQIGRRVIAEALRRSAAHVLVADLADPVLDDPSEHHLRRVLRLRDGETITLTDGTGGWRRATYTRARVEPDGDVVVEPSPGPPLTLAVAPPKGERAEWLVQKCTEAGVDRIIWLDAERSVVRWDGDRAARHLGRLRRIATEAALQSRRVWLPVLDAPVPATEILPLAAAAEPGGRAVQAGDTTIAVGPEGGWSDSESQLAASHVSLGPNVLRVETAAVVAVTLMVDRR
jgi:16S rRNA (uracil1498-N3)-methyltransferase